METAVKFDKVELVFDSCETITIGLDAIRWMSMDVGVTEYRWDERNRCMDMEKTLTRFRMSIDLTQLQALSLSDPVHIEPGLTEKQYIVKRLSSTDDITHVYVNGEPFRMPWGPGDMYQNSWHRTTRTNTTDGTDTVEYDIGEENTAECVYSSEVKDDKC